MLDIVAGAASAAETSSAWTMFDSTATVVGFLAAVLSGLGWLVTWYRLRGMTKAQGQLEQMQGTLLLNYNTALEENKRLAAERDQWIPCKWLEVADKEVASGNDAKAIDLLDAGYRRVREDLGLVVHRLVEYHTSRMIGFDASIEHESALRLSRVAQGLAPSNREIVELATDLDGIEVVDGEPLQIAASRFDAANPDEAQRVITAAMNAYERLFAQGRYRPCLLLCRRALRLIQRYGFAETELGFAVQYRSAQALIFCGRNREAFGAVTELLPVRERVQGSEHPDVLATRDLRAQILSSLGRYSEAFGAVTELLPVLERVKGSEHPDVLTTRWLMADILSDLGRYSEAIDAVTELLPVRERVQGSEHPGALATRYLRAQILSDLGRYSEAIDAVTELLPVEERVKGSEHPDVLTTRWLMADILCRLGRYSEALDAATELLPIYVRVQDSEHPHVLVTRRLHAEILLGMQDVDQAETIITDVITRQIEQLGRSHNATLISELVLLEIFAASGRKERALAEIDRVYDGLLAATGPDHYRVKQAAALRDKLKPKSKRSRKSGNSGKTGED